MPARLHHERVAHSGSTPSRWMLLTHGIFGAGMNWRGIARKLVDRRREWGVVLVDLRLHGRSEAGASPHTLAACAEDVRALIAELGGVAVLAGHSFGGKVMAVTRNLVEVQQTYLLDSTPSARPSLIDDPHNSVGRVLALLARAPRRFGKREEFVELVKADGHDAGLGQWLAMNLVPDTSGELVMRLDPDGLRELLVDYYSRDLWDALRDPRRGDVELVIADRSSTFSDADRAQLPALPPHIHVHHIDAGHWLHIEAPDAVLELFARTLP
ncbi:MAG: alpha/beta hydrolase [Kofleriaceae bacterium]|nr:alpha/beta hydrolase [Kofleriaceae bacterium]